MKPKLYLSQHDLGEHNIERAKSVSVYCTATSAVRSLAQKRYRKSRLIPPFAQGSRSVFEEREPSATTIMPCSLAVEHGFVAFDAHARARTHVETKSSVPSVPYNHRNRACVIGLDSGSFSPSFQVVGGVTEDLQLGLGLLPERGHVPHRKHRLQVHLRRVRQGRGFETAAL